MPLQKKKEKQYSSDQSSRVNKAYRTLLSPIGRGLYMLELAGVNFEREAVFESSPDDEKNKILMNVLELNERIDETREAREVAELEKMLEVIMRPFENELQVAFEKNDFKAAVDVVAKMKYYRNIDERLKDLKLKYNLVGDDI